MSAPPIHARTDGGSCFSGILHLRTSQFATVPTSDRFLMPFPFKQFFAALHLTVVTIPDLEPRRSLRLRDVVPKAVLRYDPLQVHFADALE